MRRGERRKFEHLTRRIPWITERRGEWNELRIELLDGDIVLTHTMTLKCCLYISQSRWGSIDIGLQRYAYHGHQSSLPPKYTQFQMAGSSAKFKHPSIMYVDVIAHLENQNQKNSLPCYVGWRLAPSLFDGLTTLVHLVPRWVTILP